MQASFGIGESLALLLLAGLTVGYLWGWRRLRRAMPTLATRLRLFSFASATVALALALIWPFPGWSNYLLTMRSLQKVLVCMIAAPLLWQAAPVHVLVWGTRGWTRHFFVTMRQQAATTGLLHTISQPLVGWFVYVAVFLFWHDPSIAQYFLGARAAHTLAPWLLLCAALLFWWPIVDTGPRIHRRFPAWLLIVSLLSVEITNMVAGVTIAFSTEPIYAYYPALRAQLPADALPWSQLTDQVAGGAIVWVFGSLVYISSIVLVLFRLFRKEGSSTPQPLPDWDNDAKFIAPGLEHRVSQNTLRKSDLKHR